MGETGQTYTTKYYNLDAVIYVGYRVNSRKAAQFRIWATQLIKEYVIKGFALDEERLKNGRYFGKEFFIYQFYSNVQTMHIANSDEAIEGGSIHPCFQNYCLTDGNMLAY